MRDPVLWKYKTAHGDDAVTDRWDDIPQAQRTHAQPLVTGPATHSEVAVVPSLHFDPLSFGGGALVGVVVALLLARGQRVALKLALSVAVIALATGVYLGFLRREVGLSGSALTSPTAIIGDVHGAAATVTDHFGQQQKALEAVEASEK